MYDFAKTELETTKRDALSSEEKSPRERMAMFADLLRTIDCILSHLPPEERLRRMRIADQLNRRPEPWWKNVRPEALDEFHATADTAD